MTSPETPNVRAAIPVFAPGVRDAVYRHVYRDPANELGGLLVGDRRAAGSVIVGAIEAEGARGDVTSLTFTQASWASMLRTLDQQYPGAEILGWYHSHPGHGVFLSAHDRFMHQHFFPAAWQVAVVVDPQRHYEGLFMWAGAELGLVAEAGVDPQWGAAPGSALAPAGAQSPAPAEAPAARSVPARPAQPRPATPPVREAPTEPPPSPSPPGGSAAPDDAAKQAERRREVLRARREAVRRSNARRRRDRVVAVGLLVAGVVAVVVRLVA